MKAIALPFLLALACAAQSTITDPPDLARQTLYSFTHPAMGTTYSLLLYAGSQQIAALAAEQAFTEVDDVESLLSNYRPQSELSRINRLAASQTVTTDPETLLFLEQSLGWSARSHGAFDITVGALMKAWGFFRNTGHVPTPAELAAVRTKTGWQRVHMQPLERSVRFTSPGVELDPGGIGKGFAVDRVIQGLRADGVKAAMLSAGSSTIYGLGAPPNQKGWRVAVHDPAHPGSTLSTVLLRDMSLSTASCAEKHFILAGHLYCHIMDPRMLRPVEGRLQATVVAPSATDSDALSNVVFVEDRRARAAFLQRAAPDIRALVLDGTPAPDQNHQATLVCTSYHWDAPLREPCSAELNPSSADPSGGLRSTRENK